MTFKTEFLSNIKQSLPDTLNDKEHTSVFSHSGSFSNFISNAYKDASENRANLDNAINKLNQSPQLTDNPENLLILQTYISEYTNYVSMISSVARKGIGTIETLEKAQ